MKDITVLAHRGASGYEPENTIKAFQEAITLGADVIELDIRICKSGEIVVFHDASVDRTTNGRGLVADMTLKELKSLDAGSGEKIPTLEEALDHIDKRAIVNIELKSDGVAAPLADLLKTYIGDKGWAPEMFIITSFNTQELEEFYRINPGTRISVFLDTNPILAIARARHFKAYSIHIPKQYLKRWIVKLLQNMGYKVFTYTLNSHHYIDRAKRAGVDGIFSDYPDKI